MPTRTPGRVCESRSNGANPERQLFIDGHYVVGVQPVAATYWDPQRDAPVRGEIRELTEIDEMLATVLAVRSGRARSALELARGDGSTVSLATDGVDAFLVWVDSLGDSYSTVGRGQPGSALSFDYMGSLSEAQREATVSLADGRDCLRRYATTGTPVTDRVLFEPD